MLVSAVLLFYVGVAFCFFILMPLIINFAVGFATESLRPWLTADAYFALATRLCLAFGLLFELPMVVFALSWAGVVKPRTLLRTWRYALLIILVVSAVLTPPDVISQVMLAGPVMLLYIASVLIAMLVRRRRDTRKASEDADASGDDDGGGSV
jgi:sec-independent protein translocase protein TatC